MTENLNSQNLSENLVRLIAFYLPQYHPIQENDDWWGKGFTEWTNVTAARSLFPEHYQPRLPSDLGYYDLRLPEVRQAQAAMARANGVYGFCYYHYWFNGKLLLERPFEEVLQSGKPDFPFCLCWANEDWTRAWDGRSGQALIHQEYSPEDDLEHIRWFARAFKDQRYIRVDGKPLLLVYRLNRLPAPADTAAVWRKEAKRLGIGDLFLCRVESFLDEHSDPTLLGFDAAVEFQPDWTNLGASLPMNLPDEHIVYDYRAFAARQIQKEKASYLRFPCVAPSWDNSPRRKKNALIMHPVSPQTYEGWLRHTVQAVREKDEPVDGKNLVFINAWNEWGEGNKLEPDTVFGTKFLEATHRVVMGTSKVSEQDDALKNKIVSGELNSLKKMASASMPAIDGNLQKSQTQPYLSLDPSRQNGHPRVSILVLCYNHLNLTKACIGQIRNVTPEHLYELVVIDNNSTDGTRKYLKQLQSEMPAAQLQVVLNSANLGFVGGNNRGALHAHGDYLLFLNNDTLPQPGWLEAMLSLIEKDPGVGVVGARLVYPNGTLQEAGSVMFTDASGFNFGHGEDPDSPEFNYVREVDYCSGACLLIRNDLFRQLGQFDTRYAPAYYEDTDLCFTVRKAGYKVLYQPKATVIHLEGGTAGTNVNTGAKHYQVVNRPKFQAKWAVELASHQRPTSDRKLMTRSAARTNGAQVLVVHSGPPLYDRQSGGLRIFNLVRLLIENGSHVTYACLHGKTWDGMDLKPYVDRLQQMGVMVHYFDDEIDPFSCFEQLLRERDYDVALLPFYHIAKYFINSLRSVSPKTYVVVDSVDVHFLRKARQAFNESSPEKWLEYRDTRQEELDLYRKANAVLTVTEQDKDVLAEFLPDRPIYCVPDPHHASKGNAGFDQRKDMMFLAGFKHTPNVDAVMYFYQEIWPEVQKRLPQACWYIVGDSPTDQVKALAGEKVIVTGYLPDITTYLQKIRVSVAPLRYGAGMKGKIAVALSNGLPTVTTPIGAEGMGMTHAKDVLIAQTPQEFADAIELLYTDKSTWEATSQAGCELVDRQFGDGAVYPRLAHALQLESYARSYQPELSQDLALAEIMAEGYKAYSEGAIPDSEILFARCLEKDPELTSAIVGRALCLLSRSQPREAEALLLEAVAKGNQLGNVCTAYALFQEGSGHLDKAGLNFKRAVQEDPQNLWAIREALRFSEAQGDLAWSAQLCDLLITVLPEDTNCYLRKSAILAALGDRVGQVDTLRKAMQRAQVASQHQLQMSIYHLIVKYQGNDPETLFQLLVNSPNLLVTLKEFENNLDQALVDRIYAEREKALALDHPDFAAGLEQMADYVEQIIHGRVDRYEQRQDQARETLQLILDSADLPAAVEGCADRLDEDFMAVLRLNIQAARSDGDGELAEGLEVLAEYVLNIKAGVL